MPLSRTEAIARALMAHYHPELKPVYGVRPEWLQNPETLHALELDIYYPDLQIAIEVDGAQHRRPVAYFHEDNEAFQKQLRHDTIKEDRCREWGVRLYHLTIFDLTETRWEAFLRRFEQENRLLPNRLVSRPAALFAEAEKLSRRRVVRTPDVDLPRTKAVKRTGWRGFVDWLKS